MNIVIVGGAGYIGQVITNYLIKNNHHVKIIDIFNFCLPGRLPKNVSWTACDTRALRNWDFTGADAVLDLAAISNDPSGDIDPALTRQINVEARSRTARLAKGAGVSRYVLFSSCSVYGVNDDLVDEGAPTRPLTEYAACNVRAEERILPLADAGFCATALRLATVFGPSAAMRFDLVVNTMCRYAFEQNGVVVTGGGEQYRPLIHVHDVAEAALQVLGQPRERVNGEIFNLVHRNARMRDLAIDVISGIGRPLELVIETSTIDRRNYRVDGGKAERVLGFTAKRTVEAAARDIVTALAEGRLDTSLRSIRLNGYRRMAQAMAS
jgi:nucleoside-diphosphate-sugar epimerase